LQAKNIAAPVSNPTQGLLVFNTATSGNAPNQVSPGYYYWEGAGWNKFSETDKNKEFYWDAYMHPDTVGILNWAPIVKTGNVNYSYYQAMFRLPNN
jgi:aspartyl/asparaginyl beta-hydroxylase (cupin superfamily)